MMSCTLKKKKYLINPMPHSTLKGRWPEKQPSSSSLHSEATNVIALTHGTKAELQSRWREAIYVV